jgi:hypothetical protein
MIGRNMALDAELVEQPLLHHRSPAHHRRILLKSGGVNQDFEPPATPTFSTQSTQGGRLLSNSPPSQKQSWVRLGTRTEGAPALRVFA